MDLQGAVTTRATLLSRPFLLACFVNATMGLLYVWSLFLYPLEAYLHVERAALSLVPALALVTFTIGMVVHHSILRAVSFRAYLSAAFGCAALGYLLFAIAPSFRTLLIGYGLLFGFASGLGYGLALAIAATLPGTVRSTAIGWVMAAFAISGVVLSLALAGPIGASSPAASFLLIGFAIAAIGAGAVLAVPSALPRGIGGRVAAPRASFGVGDVFQARFVLLFFTFFFIRYDGLMIVAHASGIVAAKGLTGRVAGLATGTLTFGYILGSLLGGRLVDTLSSGTALIVSNVTAGMGLLILLLSGSQLLLAGTLLVGAVFGGSASLMPVLIGNQYGPDRIGEVYGKLMVAYGAGGLLGPWITGELYGATGPYGSGLAVGLVMCAAGICLGVLLQRLTPRANGATSP